MTAGGVCGVEGSALRIQLESFTSLAEEWEALAAASRSASIFTTWRWQRLWYEHLGQMHRPVCLTVRNDAGRLAGLAPFAEREGVVEFGGGADVADYLDVLTRDAEGDGAVRALAEATAGRRWETIDLRSVPAESPFLAALPGALRAQGYEVTVERDDVCPWVALPDTWDEYLAALGKKDRHELRRKLRRLEAAGQVRWCVASEPRDLPGALDDFLRLHRLSRTEKALFMDEQREHFFRALGEAFVTNGAMRLYFLELDGQRVASTICFDHRDETWLYNSGYDPQLAHLSVGLLLKAHCLRDAIARGRRRFDFLRGNERYKYDLGATDRLVMRLRGWRA